MLLQSLTKYVRGSSRGVHSRLQYLRLIDPHLFREKLRLSIGGAKPFSRLQKVIVIKRYRYDLGVIEEQECNKEIFLGRWECHVPQMMKRLPSH